MKKIYFLLFTSFCFQVSAQQLENNGFENWENAGTVADEPTEWSSIKTANANSTVISGAPQVWSQSTDAHSGSYSVQLQNKTSFGIVATGTITNGRVYATFNPSQGYVYTDQADPQWNFAFTGRPDSLVGWYKYTSQSGDHGKAEVILHTGDGKNPENGTQTNFVARARFDMPSTSVSSWTRFSVPFHYYKSGNPEYALAVLTSGDSTIAKDGSIALFDDIEFIYNPLGVNETSLKKLNVFTDGNTVYINGGESVTGAQLKVYDISGRMIFSSFINTAVYSFQLNDPSGIYLCEISTKKDRIVKKVVIE